MGWENTAANLLTTMINAAPVEVFARVREWLLGKVDTVADGTVWDKVAEAIATKFREAGGPASK